MSLFRAIENLYRVKIVYEKLNMKHPTESIKITDFANQYAQ